jgi:hypothetical protein
MEHQQSNHLSGKTDNTAINLSAIASGTGGFIINQQSNHLSHRR